MDIWKNNKDPKVVFKFNFFPLATIHFIHSINKIIAMWTNQKLSIKTHRKFVWQTRSTYRFSKAFFNPNFLSYYWLQSRSNCFSFFLFVCLFLFLFFFQHLITTITFDPPCIVPIQHSLKNLFWIGSPDKQIIIVRKYYIIECTGYIMKVVHEYKKQYLAKNSTLWCT